MNTEYVIMGDTERFNDCLVAVCGSDKDHAMKVLNRMINNPTENDKLLIKGHHNLRVQEVNSGECWWNDPFLAN